MLQLGQKDNKLETAAITKNGGQKDNRLETPVGIHYPVFIHPVANRSRKTTGWKHLKTID
jgi:hypothetical protein